MFTMNANSISTRGFPFGATAISTCGFIYRIEITEVVNSGGTYKKGPQKLPKYKPQKSWVPQGNQPKVVNISVYAMGQIYTETIMVDPTTEVTVNNVDIVEVDGNILINVVGVSIIQPN